MNVKSAEECLALYYGVAALKTQLQIDWVLRAGVVFVVSALDTYFHDKVKYRVGRFSMENLPPALARFQIPVSEVSKWSSAERKGNVLRNWVTEYLAVRPLQSPNAIVEALKLAGITDFWDSIEPNEQSKHDLLRTLSGLVKRRNQIAHEGDRMTSRRSGKKLRDIDHPYLVWALDFAKRLVAKIEIAFPG